MQSEKTRVMIVSAMVMLLSLAAGAGEFPHGGPMMFRPEIQSPQLFPAMREYAEMLRVRAREIQALADHLRREADGLDEIAKAQFAPGRGPQEADGRQRELMEIKEALGRAEREGRHEEAAELRRHAQRLRDEMARREGDRRRGELDELKGRTEDLRREAAKAQQQGRFDDAQRLEGEAQNIEMKVQREREVRAMAEHVRTMREKAVVMREQSQQAKREGRHDEAKEQWAQAERIERDVQDGVRKIERFKAEFLVKDLRTAADRAKARGSHEEAEALANEARQIEAHLNRDVPRDPQRNGDLARIVEELRGEIKQLRREMEEMRARLDQREAK